MQIIVFDTAYSATTGEHVGGLYIPTVEHSDTSDVLIDGVGLADGPGPLGDWHALTGHTAQHGYRGAVMHPSESPTDEQIREWVREAGGDVFAVVAVMNCEHEHDTDPCNDPNCDDSCADSLYCREYGCPDEPVGWAIIYRNAA